MALNFSVSRADMMSICRGDARGGDEVLPYAPRLRATRFSMGDLLSLHFTFAGEARYRGFFLIR